MIGDTTIVTQLKGRDSFFIIDILRVENSTAEKELGQ